MGHTPAAEVHNPVAPNCVAVENNKAGPAWLPASHARNHVSAPRYSRSAGLRTPSAPRFSTYEGSPFNVYAIDARDGTILWHYYWKTRGGTALQTRGVGMWRNYVYFTMHDDWVVCLDSKTGKEVWRHEIAPHDQQYFSSNAPMVIGDHIYKTGKTTWRKELNGGSAGLLSTAGGVLFLSNGQNVEAWDAATGRGLWYSQIGGLSAPPETFLLDGKQHMLFSAGGGLFLFVLN